MSPSSRKNGSRETVKAAGALVWRENGKHLEVLLVHRPRYDDWSIPKGKVDPCESVRTCAVREVAEETGVQVILGQPLSRVHYKIADGSWKRRLLDAEGNRLEDIQDSLMARARSRVKGRH